MMHIPSCQCVKTFRNIVKLKRSLLSNIEMLMSLQEERQLHGAGAQFKQDIRPRHDRCAIKQASIENMILEQKPASYASSFNSSPPQLIYALVNFLQLLAAANKGKPYILDLRAHFLEHFHLLNQMEVSMYACCTF